MTLNFSTNNLTRIGLLALALLALSAGFIAFGTIALACFGIVITWIGGFLLIPTFFSLFLNFRFGESRGAPSLSLDKKIDKIILVAGLMIMVVGITLAYFFAPAS